MKNKSDNDKMKLFEDYFGKMLTKYAGITEAEYDEISKRKREEKIGKQP